MRGAMKEKPILEFQGEYRFLSNFWVELDGSSVESAYQAAKCKKAADFNAIIVMPPGQAKRAGQGVQLREDWEDIKFLVMARLVARKFLGSRLQLGLIKTGNALLQEGNNWGDTYWGVDLRTGVGENNLGKILMTVREIAKQRS